MPTAELLLARGKAYELQMERDTEGIQDLRRLAHKDFSDAIKLVTSEEVEKEARLGRVRIFVYSWEEREKDLEWLKAHTKGRELGEVLYWEVEGWDAWEEQAALLLSQAIELDYRHPGVYWLRAEANFRIWNYGLALQDIDTSIGGTEDAEELAERLCLRASILIGMKRFREAYATLSQARQLGKGDMYYSWGAGLDGIEGEVLWRYGMAHEFHYFPLPPIGLLRAILQALVAVIASSGSIIPGQGLQRGRAAIERGFPEIVHFIKEIVGEEFWQKCKGV